MGKETGISWCDHTANPWWGCTEVHAGCDHCYARTLAKSKGKGQAWEGLRYAAKSVWANLLKWDADAAKAGEVRFVFTGSMMDIFEKSLPACDWHGNPIDLTTGDLRDRYFREIVPATPNLLHLLLTKRPGNIGRMVPDSWRDQWPANVMTGTSPVDQETADTLILQLLKAPGPHFLSMEPLLGPVDLGQYVFCDRCRDDNPCGRGAYLTPLDNTAGGCWFRECGCSAISWIIVGGESGSKARPFDLAWARSIKDQCAAAGVACFVKQIGKSPYENGMPFSASDSHGGDIDEFPMDLRVREFPSEVAHV